MDNNLKPCPFCGGKAKLKGGPWAQESFSVWCGRCMHHMDGGMNEIKLIEKWNSRIPTEREAPCQYYCEQAAFKIEIRKLRSLLAECLQRFKQYDMDVDDSSLAPEAHKKFMRNIENEILHERFP